MLLQAQNSTEPVNTDVLRQHLVEQLHIPEDQIKVATGTQRELEGLNLSARDCTVRYIITVQALREGWDCPFAYILCSVQSIRSATAMEQLLGRVLRMPYARKRCRPSLNKAYAHVTESETGLAANALADRLIDGMGFDPLDMSAMIAPQLPLGLQGGDGSQDHGPLFASEPSLPSLQLDVPADKQLPAHVQEAVEQGQASVSTDGARQRIQWRGEVPAAVAEALVSMVRGKQKEQLGQSIERHNAVVQGALAPSNRGEVFAVVPRLGYRLAGTQGELHLLERESVTEELELNLLAEPVSLPGFQMVEQGTLWEVYLDGARLRVGKGDAQQLPLDAVSTTITEDDLTRWLAAELQHPTRNAARDVLPAHLRAFVLATVRHLVNDQHLPLAQLARHQYPLMQKLALRIAELRDKTAKASFTQLVLDGGWAMETSLQIGFAFEPNCYPVPTNKLYRGKFKFNKHYYPVPADLEDGGEEWRCALAIDEHPQVKRWVRNLDSDPVAGFWLPISSGRFYPDFVCELIDGRILVVEYKGAHLQNLPKEIEKAQVGKVWAVNSRGRACFAWVLKSVDGKSLTQQLDEAMV